MSLHHQKIPPTFELARICIQSQCCPGNGRFEVSLNGISITRTECSLVPRPNRYRCVPLRGYCVENTVGNARSGLAENAEKSV